MLYQRHRDHSLPFPLMNQTKFSQDFQRSVVEDDGVVLVETSFRHHSSRWRRTNPIDMYLLFLFFLFQFSLGGSSSGETALYIIIIWRRERFKEYTTVALIPPIAEQDTRREWRRSNRYYTTVLWSCSLLLQFTLQTVVLVFN